ncbi:pentatricopeptide repeat-containing protein At3g14730-like [Zingiber officinale]|uniref:pentatricopeptide repeat-containing protein At3g14730-like n=1 Tax=Zingiber officinale TaxID=94328 RepID=UPI001C4B5A56|nr:pentatricopeptide repeat-containing protein At3g14730-like [Zingiber officinale]
MLAKPFVALLGRRLLPSLPLLRAFHSNLHACVSLLQLCAARRDLTRSRELHAHLLTTGLHSSRFAISALISLYSKCARPVEALSVFLSDRTPTPDLFVWNAALSALASNGLPADALRLFRRLFSEVGLSPDEFTFPCAIKACSDLGDSDVLQEIHAALFKVGFSDEMFAASALVHAYLKMGLLNEAEQVFDVLPQRDVVLWNSMVNGFAHLCQFARSLDYFRRMINEGVIPSKYTVTGILSVFTAWADLRNGKKIHAFVLKTRYDNEISVSNSLINLYGKCHLLEDAERIFESMQEKDVVSWNSMISAYQYSAHHSKTLQLFCQMRRNGIMLDAITVAAVLPACSHLAALRLGREIHGLVITSSMSAKDVFVVNALMDMYAKCGTLEEARLVFDRMLEPNVTSWNIMIDAYGIHGLGAEAVDLFEQMVGVGLTPDEITFVGVLSACSHAGLVETGKELLHRMESEFGLTPAMEHYSSVADMLGRAGFLEEAKGVAEKAGVRGAGVWRAYLAACRMHGEAGQAVEAAERVVEMEPQGSGSYVLMASAYGGAGKFNELAEVRSQMSQKGVRKAPGCSWVEVAGARLHAFVAGDQNHPEAEEIYTALHGLFGWMREELGHSTEVIAFHGE